MGNLDSLLQIGRLYTSSMRLLCKSCKSFALKVQVSQVCTELLVQRTMEVLVLVWSMAPHFMLAMFTMLMEITLRLTICDEGLLVEAL